MKKLFGYDKIYKILLHKGEKMRRIFLILEEEGRKGEKNLPFFPCIR